MKTKQDLIAELEAKPEFRGLKPRGVRVQDDTKVYLYVLGWLNGEVLRSENIAIIQDMETGACVWFNSTPRILRIKEVPVIDIELEEEVSHEDEVVEDNSNEEPDEEE